MLQSFALHVRLCQVFGVRFRRFRRNALTISEDNTLVLNISKCELSDGHALAHTCAQLCCARVPVSLIYEFIRTYLSTVPSNDSAISVRGALESGQVARVLEEFIQSSQQSTLLPYAIWRMEHNYFTGRGAALLIAAATVLGDGRLELDLSDSSRVFSLELAPWVEIVRKMRGNSLPCGLRGLRIDNCKLRSLGRRPHDLLLGLQWLSLKGTAISNLWTMASIISDLSSLRAVLVRGKANQKVLEHIKALSLSMNNSNERLRKRKTPLHRRTGGLGARPGSSSDPDTFHVTSAIEDSGEPPAASSSIRKRDSFLAEQSAASAVHGLFEDDEASTSESVVPYLPTSVLERVGPSGDTSGSSGTPVSLLYRYREFLLVHAKEALVFLDEQCVTPREIEIARGIVSEVFELPRLGRSKPGRTLLKLMRDRELEGSGRTTCPTNLKKMDSNPKRRRNENYLSGVRDSLMKNPGNSNDVLALDNPYRYSSLSSSANRLGDGGGQVRKSLESLEELLALCKSGPLSESQLNSSYQLTACDFAYPWPSSGVTGASEKLCRVLPSQERASLSSKADDNYPITSGGCLDIQQFEQKTSATLLSRTGFPRVEYLCQPHDLPRQFEYNEIDTRLLVYGTEHANLVVLNQDTGTVVGSCHTGGGAGHISPGASVRIQQQELPEPSRHRPELDHINNEGATVLALSWFNKDPNLFIAGSENGLIQVYNVDWMQSGKHGGCVRVCDEFNKLTSLHANCTDDKFLVSGYGRDIVLFDLATGKELERMRGCHLDHINVLKFTNHDPNVFVTSSFDTSVKKWDLRERRPDNMRRPIYSVKSQTENIIVCLSPDDKYFLVSAMNNEVNQFETATGRLNRTFNIPKNENEYSYTRSYYMNGRDYIISGSCTEDVVRIYNSETGRLYREIDMDNRTSRWSSMIMVQSLRANPRNSHCFSALLSATSETPYHVIASVDLHTRA